MVIKLNLWSQLGCCFKSIKKLIHSEKNLLRLWNLECVLLFLNSKYFQNAGFGWQQMDCVGHAPGILGNTFHAVRPGRPGCRLGKAGVRQSWETFSVVTYRTEPWARRISSLQHNYLMGKMGGKWNLPQRILWESLIMHVKHVAQCPVANGSSAVDLIEALLLFSVCIYMFENRRSPPIKFMIDCCCSVAKLSHFYMYELWKGIQMWETPA